MQNIQEVFDRIRETKRDQKAIRDSYKDALVTSAEYVKVSEELDMLRLRKKQIENTIKEQFSADLDKLDKLKLDVKTDVELMSDIALNQLVKGEEIVIIDENKNTYEPIFTVRFKKT